MTFEAAEATLWQFVQRYTGRVGYRRGVKSEGRSASPPVDAFRLAASASCQQGQQGQQGNAP